MRVCVCDYYVTVMMWHTGASVTILSVAAENPWIRGGSWMVGLAVERKQLRPA